MARQVRQVLFSPLLQVNMDEFQDGFLRRGKDLNERQLNKLMGLFDLNTDGHFTLREFIVGRRLQKLKAASGERPVKKQSSKKLEYVRRVFWREIEKVKERLSHFIPL
mmetsp:Transcript_70566/g.166407  ORF Transcript_70566/g.166407 Transcript_70566/m.166407 type:complete len:108 (-) Transcript_70566:13-336(-)